MTSVGVHEAKTNLSELLRRVEAGEEVVIRRGDKPVARLVAVKAPGTRRLGMDRGRLVIAEDFDDPMPDWFLDYFS